MDIVCTGSLQPGGPYSRLNAQPLDDTEYTDTAVTASTTYYYVVSSVAENGLEKRLLQRGACDRTVTLACLHTAGCESL